MLTPGWSDGNSFVPVSHCLLSAADNKNLLCGAKPCDGRSLAGKHRSQSRRKATDVMAEFLRSVQACGISARYVLFDSWFSSPKSILAIRNELHLDTIAMIKKSSRLKYGYEGDSLNIKEIYNGLCSVRYISFRLLYGIQDGLYH